MENPTPPEARLSQEDSQAGSQAASRAGFRQRALMQTRSNSVYSAIITLGSKDKYRSIYGRQPYLVP